MKANLHRYIKILISSLVLISGFGTLIFSQARINGIINKYGSVNTVGEDYVIVNDPKQFAQFSPGDTVLLIQMKGVRIYTFESSVYGTPESSYGPSGTHEFILIKSVDAGTMKIFFRNKIVNSTFNTEGAVQIIRVPSFNSAVVDGLLTCQPWDSISRTGGVLSVVAGNTLSLNDNIDVSGKGFKGGSAVQGLGICVNTSTTRYDKYFFHLDSLNSGFKGEGPSIRGWIDPSVFPSIYPGYAKGKGPNFTGGGGGNGMFSGGGGGANYGAGGKGGREVISCTNKPVDGGLGGRPVSATPLAGGLFPGGGGGSSTFLAGSTGASGGNGGGVVIIVCDTLKGNSRSILANGADGGASGNTNAGAGGAGAGGSVALYIRSYSTQTSESGLTISANGGNGGNSSGTFGEGGGGGGGFITTDDITTPANVIKTATGGTAGTRKGVPTGGSGTAGENLISFVPVLNEFLFNTIYLSGTGNKVDTIIPHEIPRTIIGSSPVGGSGSYTYLWQKCYSLSDTPVNIAGSNTINYTPSGPEINTVWFRRIVTDNVTSITDTSVWVKIVVLIETGAEKYIFHDKLVIYPNPCFYEAQISINDQNRGNVEIVITDIMGKRITSFRTQKESEELKYTIPVSNLSAGLYQIQLVIGKHYYYSGRILVVK